MKKFDLKVDYPCNVLIIEEFSVDGKFIYICILNIKQNKNDLMFSEVKVKV
jgi:hypothetical protein